MATFEKALELDPRSPSLLWDVAETSVATGNYVRAERAIAQGLEVNPEAHLFRLLQGTIALRGQGETARLRTALAEIPREFDPGGSVTLVGIRVALMERDAADAEHWLGTYPHARYNDTGVGGLAGTLDSYSFPPSWLRGLIARARGDQETARREFESALKCVEDDLCCCTADAKTVMMHGFVHAALGNREKAIHHGEAATATLPLERDAYDGAMLATNLAAIYAQVGEKDRAIELLESLRGIPNAATPGTLRVEWEWDALRGDARFERLLA